MKFFLPGRDPLAGFAVEFSHYILPPRRVPRPSHPVLRLSVTALFLAERATRSINSIVRPA